jgi:hypothetical protein
MAAALPLVGQDIQLQRHFEGDAAQLPLISDVAQSSIGRAASAVSGDLLPHMVASCLPYKYMLPQSKQGLFASILERFDLSEPHVVPRVY